MAGEPTGVGRGRGSAAQYRPSVRLGAVGLGLDLWRRRREAKHKEQGTRHGGLG